VIGFIKVFLLGWGSTLLFWAAALFFCYIGTEVITKYWKRKLLLGTPFFLLFLFIVHAYGVPRYFVYDDVPPKLVDGKPYYPAVKNHLIFQGPAYKKYGVISEGLTDFIDNDKYFSAFGIAPLKDYPSVSGIKSWVNELTLVGFFLLWYVFINKVHNASAASALYKTARKNNRLQYYQSYLTASKPIRFLQPFKRRNARRDFEKIRQVYITYLVQLLNKLSNQAPATSSGVLLYMANQLQTSSQWYPCVSTLVQIDDLTGEKEIDAYEKKAEYDRGYFKPSNAELCSALNTRLVETLNQFLPEKLLKSNIADELPSIELQCRLVCKVTGNITYGDSSSATRLTVAGSQQQAITNQTLVMRRNVNTFPKEITSGKQEVSRKYCATQIAQFITSDTLFTPSQVTQAPVENEHVLQTRLKQVEARQNQLFDAIIEECKSAGKDLVIGEAIHQALKNNEVLVDRGMSELYQLLADNTQLYAEFVAFESISGFLEEAVGSASE
jgi:hypothetical protein